MNIKELIKKFFLKVWNKIEDHLATIVAGVIISACSAFCIIFWEWLKTIHSLEMPGWAWVIIALGISTMPVLIVFLIMRQKKEKKKVLTGETDVKNALRQWFRKRYVEHTFWAIMGDKNEIVHFSSLDQKLGLAPGSAKRYLEDVVEEFGSWRTKNETQVTIEISCI